MAGPGHREAAAPLPPLWNRPWRAVWSYGATSGRHIAKKSMDLNLNGKICVLYRYMSVVLVAHSLDFCAEFTAYCSGGTSYRAKGLKPPKSGPSPLNLTEHLQVCQRASQTQKHFASSLECAIFRLKKLKNFL